MHPTPQQLRVESIPYVSEGKNEEDVPSPASMHTSPVALNMMQRRKSTNHTLRKSGTFSPIAKSGLLTSSSSSGDLSAKVVADVSPEVTSRSFSITARMPSEYERKMNLEDLVENGLSRELLVRDVLRYFISFFYLWFRTKFPSFYLREHTYLAATQIVTPPLILSLSFYM